MQDLVRDLPDSGAKIANRRTASWCWRTIVILQMHVPCLRTSMRRLVPILSRSAEKRPCKNARKQRGNEVSTLPRGKAQRASKVGLRPRQEQGEWSKAQQTIIPVRLCLRIIEVVVPAQRIVVPVEVSRSLDSKNANSAYVVLA
eukprot:1355043-Amphidinium_carterae.11